jgi:putative acetyltransferase
MATPEIIVRRGEPRDVAQIRDLYAERVAYADTLQLPYPSLEVWEKRLGTAADGVTCLVAVRDTEVLGQLSLEVLQRPRRRHAATIGMGVKAAARRSGVGSLLLAAAIDLCDRWLDVSRIEIEVYTDNDAALALYRKHGFVIEGTCRQYAFRDGRYADVHLMARLRERRQDRPPVPS